VSERACPNCGSRNVFYDPYSGELKCEDCGFVVEEGVIDSGPEWRAYNEEQAVARARAEPVKPFTSLSTVIGRSQAMDARRREEFRRLTLIQSHISKQDARSVIEGREEIRRLAAAVQAPSQVREEAFRLFALAQKVGLLRGRSVSSMAVACIMLACREYGVPYHPARLCELALTSVKEARRCYLLLLDKMRGTLKLRPPSPLKYIPMIASRLGLDMKVQRTAVEIVKAAAEAHALLGKPPRSVAAAALYIASVIHGERRNRAYFARAAGVTETTLRKRTCELLAKLDITVYT